MKWREPCQLYHTGPLRDTPLNLGGVHNFVHKKYFSTSKRSII